MTTTATHLPTSHIQSLHAIEDGYWWYQGRVFWATQLIRLYREKLKHRDALQYIDLGCGTGGFARQIQREFKIDKMALIDGDPAVLQLASRNDGIEAHQLDFGTKFHLPWKPNLVSCMDVLEHIKDDLGFLKRVTEQLAWGGACVISVPAFPSLYSEWDKQLGHHRRYTPRTLAAVVKQAGLSLVTMKFMWSFLMPAAPVRKLRAKRYAQSMEFEAVNPAVNRLLVKLSQWEWAMSHIAPMPFGTSLILLATKK
jgi:trans-aconitate methyltransferase